MSIQNTLKQDDLLMKTLQLSTINRLICYTDKGMLTLQIRKGDNQYHIHLDSVPLDKEANKVLMDLLFPVPQMDVPKVNKTPDITTHEVNTVKTEVIKVPKVKEKTKGKK